MTWTLKSGEPSIITSAVVLSQTTLSWGFLGSFSTGTYAGIGTKFVSSLKMLWKKKKQLLTCSELRSPLSCVKESFFLQFKIIDIFYQTFSNKWAYYTLPSMYNNSQLQHYKSRRIQYVSIYSGDLNTGLVWYSNARKLSDHWMVRYSNAIWIPD